MAQRFPIRAVYSVQVGPPTIPPFIPVTLNAPPPRLLMSGSASRSSYATLTAVNSGDRLRMRETRGDRPVDIVCL